jgi:hypothetical protein
MIPKAYSRRLEVGNRELNILAVRPPCETELNSWLSWQLLSDIST